MFRWCAYCQHLIGEAEPLDQYSITHGVCPDCAPASLSYRRTEHVSRAQEIFGGLLQAGRTGNIEGAAAILREAVGAGLRPTDLMLGLLQPALGEMGRLWASGEITVVDEHRFTAFCKEALALLPAPSPPSADAPRVLLLMADGNVHDLGVRMLRRVALEAGVFCEAHFAGLAQDAAFDYCRRERPDLVCISVALLEQVAAADDQACRLARELGLLVVLGGGVFRRQPRPPATKTPVLLTIDAFRAAVEALRAGKFENGEMSDPRP